MKCDTGLLLVAKYCKGLTFVLSDVLSLEWLVNFHIFGFVKDSCVLLLAALHATSFRV